MRNSWYERGQYASMIKEVLSLQVEAYKKENDNAQKTKIAQSIGYLGQIINSFISKQYEEGFKPEIPENEDIEIDEKIIEEFVQFELENNSDKQLTPKNDLMQDITKFNHCNLEYSNLFFTKMEDLGLKVCKEFLGYNIIKFAKMRNYPNESKIKKENRRSNDK